MTVRENRELAPEGGRGLRMQAVRKPGRHAAGQPTLVQHHEA